MNIRLPVEPFYDREMQGNHEAQNRSLHEVNEDSSIGVTMQISSENVLCRRSILVTGAFGYIGSHLVHELLNVGHEVVAVGRCVPPDLDIFKRTKNVICDLNNEEALKNIFEGHSIDTVIHLAGLNPSFGAQLNDYINANVTITIALSQIAASFGVRHFMYASSSSVYGNSSDVPLKESDVCRPISPYGMSKHMAEQALSLHKGPMNILCVRGFNPISYRPGYPRGHSVLNILMDVVQGKRSHVSIFGRNHRGSKDGTCVRDYIHVIDFCQMYIHMLDHLHGKTGVYDVVNLGRGEGVSMLELIRMVESLTSQVIPIRWEDQKEGDISMSYADLSHLTSMIQHANYQDILEGV